MEITLLAHPKSLSKNYLPSTLTFEHPLKIAQTTVVDSKGTRGNPRSSFGSNTSSRSSSVSLLTDATLALSLDGNTDPLSQFVRQELELKDPLTEIASEYETFQNKSKASSKDEVDAPPNWSSKRLGILNRFTTSEKLSISTSFLQGSTTTIKAQTVVADKVKYRLKQLDDFEDGTMSHMLDLSQQEYIQRIEQLNHELVQSWHNDHRVKALKIAIQCSKMLADTSVLSFYPSQFVLITDILDIFGKLVYERLSAKASHKSTVASSSSLKYDTQRESARETCQNWFFKIASIRELLPRLYLEMAIIKCYEFLTECEFEEILMRITHMLRGIGDPLIATYARCYLVRVGLAVVTSSKEYIHENINDFLSVYHMIFSGAIRSDLNRQRIDLATYLALYGPALDFMLQSLVHKTNIYTDELLHKCKDIKNNGPLLHAILNAFKPEFIAANASELVKILANSSSEGVLKSQLFRALGSSASRCPPLQEQRNQFLHAAFQLINTFSDPYDYMNCVETWAQFIAENFTVNEVNKLLCDIRTRMCQTKRDRHYASLQTILYKILQHFKDIELLLIQEHFLPYLDLFQKESVRIEVCKHILETFKQNSREYTCDEIITNSLMHIGKMLNDYVTALTVEDERRQITQLISSFIHRVNFGRDFERQLSFYVEARGAFSNLEAVYNTLVHAVNKLAMETYKTVQGQHTSKTAAFVKACIAYCFITIPSINAVQVQMDLYLLSGEVALLNLCLGQADACFEAAIQVVNELPRTIEMDGKIRSLETYLVSYLCNMLATLIVVPDSPEQGVLYLLRLLLEVVNKFPFDTNSTGPTIVYLHALDMLYVQSLEDFPYHIPEVVSNDELYGQDPKFLAEINKISSEVVEQILSQLKLLGQTQRATLSLDLLTRIVRYADLSNAKTFQLATNLWMLALKYENQIEAKIITHALRRMEEIYGLLKDISPHKQHLQSLKKLLLLMRGKSN